MFLLAASLFLTDPAPLEMPRAEAYFVQDGSVTRLEDRFRRGDLWYSQTVDGRWVDEDGRVFLTATLAIQPPARGADETVTRSDYQDGCVEIQPKKLPQVRAAIAELLPFELAEKPQPPRQLPRGFDDVGYWQGTNTSNIVCAYLTEKQSVWRLAVWTLAEEDDPDQALKLLERDYLEGLVAHADKKPPASLSSARKKTRPSERDLLRRDARHSVAAYDEWHTTDSETFSVLDDIPDRRDFIVTLTNDLQVMRAKYAEVLPTPLDGSNVLCVARLYATREEYQDALAVEGLTNMSWSAAYWCPERRELVAYLPEGDEKQLLQTIRHEAFHQYLSYATSMIPTSPWLNEGYAQYFEDTESKDWGREYVLTPEMLKTLAEMIPGLLTLDYEAFYAGTNRERALKYRLAWSIAVFLEKGAPKVRFDPFRNVKKAYLKELLSFQDMRRATAVAFVDAETLKLFKAEWLKWWKGHAQ